MYKYILALSFSCCLQVVFGQSIVVYGTTSDAKTGNILPFAKVQFSNSKQAALSDSLGNYKITTPETELSDSIKCNYIGYASSSISIEKPGNSSSSDVLINIDFKLKSLFVDFEEITVKAPGELPSTILIRNVIANKANNNKDKLDAYEYRLYNKIQFDLNNVGTDFKSKKLVKKLDVIFNYLDSTDEGNGFLPIILSESVSKYYYKTKPSTKREIIEASQTTGIENLQVNQFLGDMYLELNIYDNIYKIFGKSFISPISNSCQNYYKYYLQDSAFIDKNWCYKLHFIPKRKRDLCFSGDLWVNDSTFAIKRIEASVSPNANLNFVKDFYFRHDFEKVNNAFWMLKKERFIADVKLTKKSKIYGFYARKFSERTEFIINKEKENEFYNTQNTVEIAKDANSKTKQEWDSLRTKKLNKQEIGIGNMIDSLNQTPYFKRLKNLAYMGTTGYHPLGILEVGNVFSLVSFNPVEKFRVALALRTSNTFSKRIEFGLNGAYGFGDNRIKYGGLIRWNLSQRKRSLLSIFYNYDIEQIGVSPYAVSMGNTFSTVLSTAPFDKLTFITKAGVNLEKDIKKDIVGFIGLEWKEYQPLGLANYLQSNAQTGAFDTISRIKTSEITARLRWAKNEEFISGAFDRTSIRSKYPIIAIQGVFGIKGILGSMYSYQKTEIQLEHNAQIGILGRLYYGAKAGYIFGTLAYPLLNAHPGNQSLWLMSSAFNKLDFLEFISDQYVEGFIENHWDGFFFNRVPLIKKLNLRLVSSARIAYGNLSSRHQSEMIYPGFIRYFNKTPYIESAIGIENIFKFIRVDLVWRMTHNDPGSNPLGIRAKLALNF
ncbi:DUF5686 and carboxypeptidase regulatory-like domain-containing protein [Crocinitomicaceae bacterium]|nr:DUF5686 and carboxypeptidase regulatory-like domain-containing protein [Crocinitomicaceae bacterium]